MRIRNIRPANFTGTSVRVGEFNGCLYVSGLVSEEWWTRLEKLADGTYVALLPRKKQRVSGLLTYIEESIEENVGRS